MYILTFNPNLKIINEKFSNEIHSILVNKFSKSQNCNLENIYYNQWIIHCDQNTDQIPFIFTNEELIAFKNIFYKYLNEYYDGLPKSKQFGKDFYINDFSCVISFVEYLDSNILLDETNKMLRTAYLFDLSSEKTKVYFKIFNVYNQDVVDFDIKVALVMCLDIYYRKSIKKTPDYDMLLNKFDLGYPVRTFYREDIKF